MNNGMAGRRRHRVLFIECNEDGSVGGSHKVLYDMLLAMDQERFEPVVLFYQNNRFVQLMEEAGFETLVYEDVRAGERAVHESGNKLGKLREIFAAVLRRKRFLQQHRIDLVHMNNSPRTSRDTWMPACRMAGIPIVASSRGDARRFPGSGLKPAIHRWLIRRHDLVAAVSEYVAAGLRDQGIAPERVRVVHDGINQETLARLAEEPKPRDEVRADLGVPDGRVFVIEVGNIRPWKGQDVVLKALTHLTPEERELFYVVFIGAVRDGDRAYYEELVAFVEEEGLGDVVSFAGSRTDVPDIVQAADIALHSSVLAEPGGTVVIEAMAYGAPVIAADKGGHLDYYEGDITGLSFDVEKPEQLAAHMLRLGRDPDLRSRMVVAAKERSKVFTIEATAQKMEALYDELLG